MSGIWNAHALTLLGDPAIGRNPDQLRVMGDNLASAAQLAMAQAAFAVFCTTARVSRAPNPMQIGRLPDGTPFRIVTIGNTTVMEIWPAAGGDELRKSGIALALVGLDGSPIPSLSKDGVPIGYLLTPEVVKTTRKASGKWRVRTPKPLNGGKAVNVNTDGTVYYAGVQGNLNTQMPFQRAWVYGVNGLAYDDDLEGTEPLWQRLKQVGRSRGEPLPFHYASGDTRRAMQIIVRSVPSFPIADYFLDLYVGPAKGDKDEFVGELVHTELLPSGRSLDYRSITFKGDGTTARATGTDGSQFAFLTIHIAPTALSVSLDRRVPQSNKTGSLYYDTFQDVTSGTPGEPGYFVQTTHIFGSGDSPDFGARFDVDEAGSYVGPGAFYGWGDLDMVQYGADAHRYDRRGLPVDGAITRRGITMSSYSQQVLSQRFDEPPDPVNQRFFVTVTQADQSRRTDTSYGTGPNKVLRNDEDTLDTQLTFIIDSLGQVIDGSEVRTVSGSGSSMTDSGGGHAMLFNDPELDFQIFYDRVVRVAQTWNWVLFPPVGFGKQYTSDTTTTSDTLKVVCKGQELLSRPVNLSEPYRHLVLLAADPMTGSLMVNLQEARTDNRVPRASWIFAVDDTGARPLADIMKLPAGQDLKVVSNASLFSV